MPDFFTECVVQPTIPHTDMTCLERLLLGAIFETEASDEGLYLFSRKDPTDFPSVLANELRTAHAASIDVDSRLNERVAALLDGDDVDGEIEIDLGEEGWAAILKDIVRRSEAIDSISVVAVFSCTRMQPDAFGGMAMLITNDAIRVKNTDDLLDEFLDAHRAGNTKRSHALLTLDESEVRPIIQDAIETDDSLSSLSADAISDDDIHAACMTVAASTDLSEERGSALFNAAIAAIRNAEQRQRPD